MGILLAIITGFVVGLLARFIKPKDDSAGYIATTALGIVGALVGSLIGRAMGLYQPGQPAGLIMSILGAIIVLYAYKTITRKE
jgi:uncharacterized membrane protein YeaQ/YmgE (transglycosylase-associated protein family)